MHTVQRVLNDLQKTRISRRLMVWLLFHPLPLRLVNLYLFFSLPVCRWSSLPSGEEGAWVLGRGGGGAKSYDSEKAKSFNTL
jgi:hypothetical protein